MYLRSSLLAILLLVTFASPASSSPPFASHLPDTKTERYENRTREIPGFFSAANEPLLLFISGLIILSIATALKSELARKPS
jgi:hypothetical protein